MNESVNTLTIEDFKNWESEELTIRFTDKDIRQVRIMEVNPCGEKKSKSRIPFSLILLSDFKEKYYTQGTFAVTLPDNREEMVFMVPIGIHPESGGMQYEVVFN